MRGVFLTCYIRRIAAGWISLSCLVVFGGGKSEKVPALTQLVPGLSRDAKKDPPESSAQLPLPEILATADDGEQVQQALEEAAKIVTGQHVPAPRLTADAAERESSLYISGVALPPVADAFLVALLSVVEFEPQTDSSGRLTTHRQTVDPQKLMNLMRILKMVVHVYGSTADSPRKVYSGPAIASVREYFEIMEPTRGETGTAEGDLKKLLVMADRYDKDPANFPKAPLVDVETRDTWAPFANYGVKFTAAMAQHLRARHFQSLMMSTAATSANDAATNDSVTRSVVEEIFKSFAGFFLRPGNAAMLIRTAKRVAEAPVETPEQAQLRARVNASHPLDQIADSLDKWDTFGRQENLLLDVITEIARLPTGKFVDLAQAFSESMRGVVNELCSVGTRASQALEFRFLRDQNKQLFDTLTLLFDQYPKLFPSEVMKNILLDIIRLPRDSSNYAVLKLVLKHGGPILINMLQAQAHRDDLGPFKSVFRDLQSDNRPAPFQVIWEEILKDPNRYADDITEFDPIPTKVGKAFQLHRGVYRGKQVAIRVRRPGIRELLDVELTRMLLPISPMIANVLLPPGGTPQSRSARTKRLISLKHQAMVREMDVALTVRNQNAAKAMWENDFMVNTDDFGAIKLQLRVPEAVHAVPGSTVMIMDWVDGAMSAEKFAGTYPGVMKRFGELLPGQLYDHVLFKTIREEAELVKKKEGLEPGLRLEDIKGISHNDMLSSNILWMPPHTEEGGTAFRFYLVDWGLVSQVPVAEAKKILLLSFGAAMNLTFAITDALWTLQQKERDGFGLSYREVKTIVAAQVKKLGAQYWGAAEWIQHFWLHGHLNFPDYLLGLHDAKTAMESTYSDTGNSKEDMEKFMARLSSEHRWQVVRLALGKYPVYSSPFRWLQAGVAQATYWKNQCAEGIANWLKPNRTPLSPLE